MWQLSLILPHSLARFFRVFHQHCWWRPCRWSCSWILDPGPTYLIWHQNFSLRWHIICRKAFGKATLLQHEWQKKLKYNERIVNVHHSTFCPFIFTTAGAASPKCVKFLQRLCGMLAYLKTECTMLRQSVTYAAGWHSHFCVQPSCVWVSQELNIIGWWMLCMN